MKKTLALILTLVMVLAMTVPAFAAEGDFIVSPGKKDPTVVDADNESEDCPAEVVVTPYTDRETLGDDVRAAIEAAYEDIAKETDEWKAVVASIADQLAIDAEALAVVDLFDIGYTGCDDHSKHGNFTITLAVDDLDNFAGVVQYLDGKWQFVLGATAADGKVQFTVSQLSPVALVANTESGVQAPQTDDSLVWICGAMMLTSVIGLAVIVPGFAKKNR